MAERSGNRITHCLSTVARLTAGCQQMAEKSRLGNDQVCCKQRLTLCLAPDGLLPKISATQTHFRCSTESMKYKRHPKGLVTDQTDGRKKYAQHKKYDTHIQVREIAHAAQKV